MEPRFDTDEMRDNEPQTEDSEERGYAGETADEDLGQSEIDDGDDAGDIGDIADEGSGHRG